MWYKPLVILYHKLRPVRVTGKGNKVVLKSRLKSCDIRIIGNGNKIFIDEGCSITGALFYIVGNNSEIHIGKNVRLHPGCHVNAQSGSKLVVGDRTTMRKVTFDLSGANITIGRQCMFSFDIRVVNHDGHRIFDTSDTSKVINAPKDIILSDHVWVGRGATILKGSRIGSDSIVGLNSVVARNVPDNVVVAGNPARIVKENVTWDF